MDVSDIWYVPDIPLEADTSTKADIEDYFRKWGEMVNTNLDLFEQGKSVKSDKM